MAQFGKDSDNFCAQRAIRIIGSENTDNFTTYVIEVTLGPYSWIIKHRYSEFHELHEKLISAYHLDKHLLPPKKIFGNNSVVFIKKRQNELQIYLQSILTVFSSRVPSSMASFLDFHKYEIHGITHVLAEELYHRGDLLLQAKELFQVTTLQLHALTERLKLPEPTCDSGDVKKDIGHILDFITRVYSLKICGSREHVGSSNVDMNTLRFDLTLFKSVKHLQLVNCNLPMILGLVTVKQTAETLNVHHSLKSLRDILSQEAPYWQSDNNSTLVTYWMKLTSIDLSYNSITSIDDSVQLMPNVSSLNLSHNHLESLTHLQLLCKLTHLDLSHNAITRLDSLHTKLGNLQSLHLVGNKLESMQGFSKLFSLQVLNLSNNEISQLLEVKHVSQLPCLENLMLVGNPVVIVPDYRTKVLAMFGDRTVEVKLDNISTTQQELDTVFVLQAIHKAQHLKSKHKTTPKKTPSEVPISDPDHASSVPNTLEPLAPTATPHTTHSDLRSTVETIRTQGGDDWLSLLNKMRWSPTPSQPHREEIQPTDKSKPMRESFESCSSAEEPIPYDVTTKSGTNRPTRYNASFQSSQQQINSRIPPNTCGVNQPISEPVTCVKTGSTGSNYVNVVSTKLHESIETNINTQQSHDKISIVNNITTNENKVSDRDNKRRAERLKSVSKENLTIAMVTEATTSKLNQPQEEIYDKSMFVVPETLPNFTNREFLSKLRKRLLATEDEDSLKSGLPCIEQIAQSLWCYVIQYTYPGSRMPACVTLTNRHVFIQHLKAPESESTVPELETYYIMPVFNVQQIVVGHDWSYVRLQESFVGPTGTFTIIGFDNASIKEFVLRLRTGLQPKVTAENIASQTDVIDLSVDGLSAIVSHITDLEKTAAGEVQVLLFTAGQIDYYPACLIVTQEKVYIFRDNCSQIPPPTYELSRKVTSQFELLQSHSIMAKISDLRVYELSGKVLSEGPFNSRREGHSFIYEEYGISMLFHEDEELKPVLLDICLPSLKIRSEFLEKLTQIRSDFARNLSPMHREDPEGCNEMSLDLTVVATDEEIDADLLKSAPDDKSEPAETLGSTEVPKPSVSVEVARSTPNPRSFSSLELVYPTHALLQHLDKCLASYDLLKAMPQKLEFIASMSSDMFVDYFHSNLAQIGQSCEQLRHVLWTNVVSYKNPHQELLSCVILTTRAVYFLSDDQPSRTATRPMWMTHARHKSDTPVRRYISASPDHHNSSGIVVNQKDTPNKLLKTYKIYELKEIRQVNFGVFDQCLRLTGTDEHAVHTLVTRDAKTTDEIRKQLVDAFSLLTASPVPELERSTEADFYSLFKRSASTTESTISGKRHFRYPTEEVLSDWSFVIRSSIPRPAPDAVFDISFYVLGYFYHGPFWDEVITKTSPRSIVLTNLYLCLCLEDLVSYPIPDFARGLPESPRQEITDVRKIELLKRVALYGEHALTLIFSDEVDDIIVDASFEYFGPRSVERGRQSPPEVSWTFLTQTARDREKLVESLCCHWEELNRGAQLMVHRCDVA